MRNKKLIFILVSLFLGTLAGCGQKGPLYEAPPASQNEKPKDNETN